MERSGELRIGGRPEQHAPAHSAARQIHRIAHGGALLMEGGDGLVGRIGEDIPGAGGSCAHPVDGSFPCLGHRAKSLDAAAERLCARILDLRKQEAGPERRAR